MVRTGRRALLVVVVSAMVALPTVAGPTPTLAAVGDCLDGWRPMPIAESIRPAVPMGAASLGGKPAWWVGKHEFQWPAIARWRDGAWREVLTPWQSDGALTSVSAVSPSAAWTVGYRPGSLPRMISARWNGSSWIAIPVPHPGGRMASLADVVAIDAGTAWAVGERLVSGRVYPVVMRYSAGQWSNLSPSVGTAEGGLSSVTRAPDGSIWAVGWRSQGDRARPWVLRRSGGSWHDVSPASVVPGRAILTDITFRSANEGWLVGFVERVTGGGITPILQVWRGSGWEAAAAPWPDVSIAPTAVKVDPTGEVTVGAHRIGNHAPSAALAAGTPGNWLVTTARTGESRWSWTADLAPLADGAFAVGRGEVAEAFVRCDGGSLGVAYRAPSAPSTAGDASLEDLALVVAEPVVAADASPSVTTFDGGYSARDVTYQAGLKMRQQTYSGAVADFNGDGWPDIFINRHIADVPLLFLGGPGGFAKADARFSFTDRHGCTVGNADGNALPDLFCSTGRWRGTNLSTHELLLDVGASGGTAATMQFGVQDPSGRGRLATFARFGGGELDGLFVVNEPIRTDGLPANNRLYRPSGGSYMQPAPELGLDRSAGGACVDAENLDADPEDEILLCMTDVAAGVARGLHIFDFDGVAFVDRTAAWGVVPAGDKDVAVADFDGDGRPDLAQLTGKRLRVSLRRSGGYVVAYDFATTKAVAIAVGDINGDARADVYISRSASSNGAHVMLLNSGSGRAFTSVPIPQASGGSTDDVLAIDHDRNGLTDFVTLNGHYSPGPVKLIAFFPPGG